MEIIENNKLKLQIERIGLKKNNWQEIEGKVNTSFDVTYKNSDSLEVADTIKKGSIVGELEYKGLFVKMDLNYNLDRYEVEDNKVYKYPYYYVADELSIGYKKTLNDIFYSEDEYDNNSIGIKEKIELHENNRVIIKKKEEIIDKYVEIKNTQLKLSLKEIQLKELEETLNILEFKLELNESTKIDFNIMKLEIKKTKEEIEYLKREINNSKKSLFDLIGLDNYLLELEDIKELSIEKTYISDSRLKALEHEVLLERENLKYIKRQTQWPIEAFALYDTVDEDYQIGLNFDFNLFEYHIEEEQKRKDIDNKIVEVREEEINLVNLIEERNNELLYLKESTETNEELSLIYAEKYNYVKEYYLNGDIGLLDYLKAQTEALKARVEYLKVKNKYYGLMYKNSINGGFDR